MNWFFTHFAKMSLYHRLQTAPTPRWLIFVIDVVLVGFSCFVLLTYDSYRFNDSLLTKLLPIKIAIVIFVYMVMNYFTKSYQCIIRLSVVEDLYRVLLLVFYSTLFLFFINIGTYVLQEHYLFSFWNLFLIGCISFTLLFMMRLGIKYAFMKFSTKTVERKKIIILGSALNSCVLASALKNETNGKFEPVALLSIANQKHNDKVNGIPIEDFNAESVGEIFAKYQCDTLVFLTTQIELMRSDFSDIFLRNGITLLVLNQVEEFNTNEANEPQVSTHIKNIQIEDLLGRDQISNNNPLIKRDIHGSVVMITGAAGSIGSEIVRQVAAFGAKEIILIDQAETPMHNMQLEMGEKFPEIKIALYVADVQNRRRMEKAFQAYNPRFVFHAAAYKHVPMMEMNPTEAILTNVMGTRNVADLSLKYKVYKFVMISTDKAVNPTNIMGATKRIAEIYVQSLFFDAKKRLGSECTQFITTRFGNVLGSNGSVIPLFRRQIEQGGPITVTHKDIIRYFMTIKEACSLVLEAGCMGSGGEIYIFDMGSPVKIYDLACRMITLAGLKVGKDIKIIETGLRPGEKLYEELLNDKELTTATSNRKIMIAKVQKYDYQEISAKLMKMIECADDGDIHSMVLNMKYLVPEYKSMHSPYEKIDKEIEEKTSAKGSKETTSQLV